MSSFYIANYNLNGYIEDGMFFYPVGTKSLIQPVILESPEKTLPLHFNYFLENAEIIFVAEEYDPLRKIKRGRFYKIDRQHPVKMYKANIAATQVLCSKLLVDYHQIEGKKFKPYEPSSEFVIKDTSVYFKNEKVSTKWKIISVEPIIGGEEVYTLIETIGMGVFPSLNEAAIPLDFYKEIEGEYASLINEAYSMPETIIDHCRDIATSLLSAHLNLKKEQREDLGALISRVDPNLKIVASSSAIIARFHPRRKPNEQGAKELSPPSQREAELCVLCVLQILKELRWSLE